MQREKTACLVFSFALLREVHPGVDNQTRCRTVQHENTATHASTAVRVRKPRNSGSRTRTPSTRSLHSGFLNACSARQSSLQQTRVTLGCRARLAARRCSAEYTACNSVHRNRKTLRRDQRVARNKFWTEELRASAEASDEVAARR
mgnify:CR=1 FL=1